MTFFARIFGLIAMGLCAQAALAQDLATVAARAQAAYFAGSAAELIKLGDWVVADVTHCSGLGKGVLFGAQIGDVPVVG